MKRWYLSGILFLTVFLSMTAVWAEKEREFLVFSQFNNYNRTISLYEPGKPDAIEVVTGKNPVVFLRGKHFLYFNDGTLFEYFWQEGKSVSLASFTEPEIWIDVLPDGPDQALITTRNEYFEYTYYVLEFSDGSIRKAKDRGFYPGEAELSSGFSPDRQYLVKVGVAGFEYRFQLVIQVKAGRGYKTYWTLPANMTVMPETPVWSPNSKSIVFFAREFNGIEGFYSLYKLDLATKKVDLIQEQVIAKYLFGDFKMGPFIPSWSPDSQYLVFQYQPYGVPTESSLVKVDLSTGKKSEIISSKGSNAFPVWSPSGKYISFLSNRNSVKPLLYLSDEHGLQVEQVAAGKGYTEWANWFRPE